MGQQLIMVVEAFAVKILPRSTGLALIGLVEYARIWLLQELAEALSLSLYFLMETRSQYST